VDAATTALPVALAGWISSSRGVRSSLTTLDDSASRTALTIPNGLIANSDWASLPFFDRNDWKRVRFGDVVANCSETCDPVAAGLDRFVAMEHLEPGSLHVRSWGNVADGTTFTRRCRPGQVLFGKRRAYQRKVSVAEFEAVVSGDIYVLAPKDPQRLLPELLPFLCLSERFFQYAVGTSAGSLSPRTNWSSLASFEFDLPPLDQQRRIAEILWAVDEVINRQHSLTAEIEAARKPVLADHIIRASMDARQCGLEALAPEGDDALKTGPFGSKLNARCFAITGIPIINIAAIGEGKVEEDGLLFLKPELANEFRSYFVLRGDLVFSRVAEIGRCMLIRPEQERSMISSNLIRIRVDYRLMDPEYLLLLLKYCPTTQNQIRQLTSTGGRLLVNTRTLSELSFAVPALHKQQRVLEEARRFSAALEKTKDASAAGRTLIQELCGAAI
jgi:type I restriction enzyme S subunit